MKSLINVSAIILVVLLMTVTSFAAPDIKALMKERLSLMGLMNVLEGAFLENEAERPRLEQRKSDLGWSATQVKKEINKWNAANAQLQAKVDSHQAKVDAHNNRCSGTYESQSYVDRCNRDAESLNAYGQTLDNEIEYNDQRRASIQEMIDTQVQQQRELQREIAQYNRDREELIQSGLKIRERIQEIDSYLDSCEAAIAAYDASPNPMEDGTMERMKAACGDMFDGN